MSQKYLCSSCVNEEFLKAEIEREGQVAACSYCGQVGHSYSLPDIAERIEAVMEEHFERTAEESDSWSYGHYEWEREGDPVVFVISDLACIEEDPAKDIQEYLEGKHAIYDKDHFGESYRRLLG